MSMIRVSSKVNINSRLVNRLTDTAIYALEQTAEELHTEVVQAQVVPRMDGTLQGEAFFVDYTDSDKGKVSLVNSTPYARRLYFHPEYHFNQEPWEETIHHRDGTVSHLKHDGNPNAKGLWFEDWLPGGSEQKYIEQTFARIYRRLSGL